MKKIDFNNLIAKSAIAIRYPVFAFLSFIFIVADLFTFRQFISFVSSITLKYAKGTILLLSCLPAVKALRIFCGLHI
jgi:hypothetical protein